MYGIYLEGKKLRDTKGASISEETMTDTSEKLSRVRFPREKLWAVCILLLTHPNRPTSKYLKSLQKQQKP